MLVFCASVNCQLGPWKFPFRKRFLFSISNLFKVNKTNKQPTKEKATSLSDDISDGQTVHLQGLNKLGKLI